MLARIFVILTLLLGATMIFNNWGTTDLIEKAGELRQIATDRSFSANPKDWPSILPGTWKSDDGQTTTFQSNGTFVGFGRERLQEPIPHLAEATVYGEFSRKITGKWHLQGDEIINTIQTVEKLEIHSFEVRSPKHTVEQQRDLTNKARQLFQYSLTQKLNGTTQRVKLVSVKQNKVIFMDAKGERKVAQRVE